MAKPATGSLFSDDPASLRRLALILYALVTPVFCLVLAVESLEAFRVPAVAAAAMLCVGGGVWLVLRPRMAVADWVITGVGVPIVSCGVAFWATGANGPAYFAVMGAPVAWAAVLFDGPVVAAGVVLATSTALITLGLQIGPLAAIPNTVVFGSIYGLVGWVAYAKASILRNLRDEVLTANRRTNALMDALPDTITRADRLGRLIEVHAPAGTPLPLLPEQLIGRPVYEFLPADAREPMQAAIAAAIESGQPQRLEYNAVSPEGWRRFESRIVRSGGDEVVVVRQDIADRVRADEHAQFIAHLVDAMDEAVTTIDLGGVVTTWSPGAERVYGWSAEEAVGRPLAELVTSDGDRDATRETLDRVLWAESARETAARVRRDGRKITVDGSYRVIPGPDGEPAGVLGVDRDITELQAERDRIAASEALHRATVTALAEGLIVFDAAGQVVTSNAAAQQIIGLTIDELAGRIPLPDGWTAVAEDGRTPVDHQAVIARLAADGTTRGSTGAFRHVDGEVVWVRINAQPLTGAAGAQAGIVVTLLDITEERRAHEHELEQARLESLEQRMNDAELVMRLDGTLVQANDRALELYGYSRDQLVGRNIRDLRGLGTEEQVTGQLAAATAEGSRFETVHRTADGSEFPVEVSSRSFESGGVPYLHSLVRDLSERKRAEAERAALEEAVTDALRDRNLVLNASPVGISRARNRLQVWTNQRLQQMFGYTEAEFEGLSSRHLYADDETWERVGREWLAILKDGLPYVAEHEMVRKGGTRFWVRLSGRAVDPDADPIEVIWTFEDISARRAAEARLAESEERLRSIVAAMSEGVVVQAADGRILLANDAAQRMLALTPEQIGDPSLRDPEWRSFREDGSPFPSDLRPRSVALRTGEAQERVIMGIQPPGEALRWVSSNTVPLVRAPGEAPYAVVSTFADVTAIRESEGRYRTLFENMQEDITVYKVVRDADGKPVDWRLAEANAEARRFFGDAYGASLGRTTAELGYGGQMREAILRSDEYAAGLVTAHQTVYFAPTDVWHHSAVFAIDQDTIVNAVMDISERVRAEEDLRAALQENEHTVVELRKALADVRTLTGLLPICMYCKKVRNDEGYWDKIEQYLSDHTDAMLSHGLCPACYETYARPNVEALERSGSG